MKRVVATFNVPDGYTDADVADWIGSAIVEFVFGENDDDRPTRDQVDPTVWEWPNFWLDVDNGQVGPDGDSTAKRPVNLNTEAS